MAIPEEIFEELRAVCRDAWQRELLSGFNGNVSVRLDPSTCCITRSGAAKGFLEPRDLCAVDIATGKLLEGAAPSSELEMHLEIYRRCPGSNAVVHTHPRCMLALSLCTAQEQFLRMHLFEAKIQRARMAFVPDFAPGTKELAEAVGVAAEQAEAVFMDRHGLCCHAQNAVSALALTEELDHLAAIQLMVK